MDYGIVAVNSTVKPENLTMLDMYIFSSETAFIPCQRSHLVLSLPVRVGLSPTLHCYLIVACQHMSYLTD